jgi:hypothetical protein
MRGTAVHIKQESNTSKFGWARALRGCCVLLMAATQCTGPMVMSSDIDKIAFQIVMDTAPSEEQVTRFLEAADDDTRSCQQKFLSAARQPAEFRPAQRGHTYIVGKLKGAISSIDRIRATQAGCAGGRIEFQARYTKVLNFDLDPAPAVAYFCVRLNDIPESIRELRIHFSQYVDDSGRGKEDWTREKALEQPILTDVAVAW